MLSMEELTQEEAKVVLPQFATTKKIAEFMDWNRQQVTIYRRRGKLPEPIGEIDNRPVWLWSDIVKFKEAFAQRQIEKAKKYLDK